MQLKEIDAQPSSSRLATPKHIGLFGSPHIDPSKNKCPTDLVRIQQGHPNLWPKPPSMKLRIWKLNMKKQLEHVANVRILEMKLNMIIFGTALTFH